MNIFISDSHRLRSVGNSLFSSLSLLSMSRYFLPVIAIFGFEFSALDRVVFAAALLGLAWLAHKTVWPYFGFAIGHGPGINLRMRALKKPSDFKPLPRWLVAQAKKELTGAEYEEVIGSLSETSIEKAKELHSVYGKLTIYDAFNLFLFELQFVRLSAAKTQDSINKASIKAKLDQKD